MTDFISRTKLPGVLIAKAMVSRTNFDRLLHQNGEELRNKLTDIGYTVKLNQATYTQLASTLERESVSVQKLADFVTRKAEVFSKILTETFKKLAEKSPHDTEMMYHLSQIIFIWDEFIDFDDYQRSRGDITKIRESIFYRAAGSVMIDLPEGEIVLLEKLKIDKKIFENILPKLQLSGTGAKFSADQDYQLLSSLKKMDLTRPEIIYFLLILESAHFIKVTEDLVAKTPKEELEVFKEISDLKEGIAKVKEIFSLDEDTLESLLEEEAENLIMRIGLDIFL